MHGRRELVDEADIRAFLRTGYPRLVGAVSLVTGSLPAAEDAVQEALVRAWERSERGDRIDALAPWVATVALNLSRSGVRRAIAERRARARLAVGRVPEPSSDRVDLQRALAALPRRQREVMVLRSFLQLSIHEIATAMGTSDGTVKSQLSKARASLAAALSLDLESETEPNHADA